MPCLAQLRSAKIAALPCRQTAKARPRRRSRPRVELGLTKEIKAKAEAPVWRRDQESGQDYALRATVAGIKAVTSEEQPEIAVETQVQSSATPTLPSPIEVAADAAKVAKTVNTEPRAGSKLASVIALLRRSEGATILALTEATGWLPHTTRAAITGVRKRGHSVVLDRDVEGASVYRLSHTQESEMRTSVPQTQEEKKPVRRQREAKAKAAA
jgi:Protein of unknown function (DUF3489)